MTISAKWDGEPHINYKVEVTTECHLEILKSELIQALVGRYWEYFTGLNSLEVIKIRRKNKDI